MDICFYYRTFKELKSNKDLGFYDPYHIMSSLNNNMKDAILSNPSGYDDGETCQILALDGNVVVGACNPFSGRLNSKGTIIPVQNGSYLYSHKDYRKENVGGELFLRITKLHSNGNNLYAGISQMAIGMYKVLKYEIFEFPRLIFLLKSKSVIHSLLKTESLLVSPLIWIADCCLWLIKEIIHGVVAITTKGYRVEEVNYVPNEIEQIVLNDEHLYKEHHDKRWFEWNLRYTFSTDTRNLKRLYVIKQKSRLEGFFMIKQEYFSKASHRGFKNVYLGSVMEWGIRKGSSLTESSLNLMAIKCFDTDVDAIQVVTTDKTVLKQLKRFFFVKVGNANMGIKLKSIKEADVKKIDNWRIRIAASDTLIN